MAIHPMTRASRVRFATGVGLWVLLGVAIFAGTVLFPDNPAPVLIVASVLFGALAVTHLLATAVINHSQRRPLILLAVALVLWLIGSAQITVGTAVTFPSRGEFFFLASYVCMAAFLLFSAGNRHEADKLLWLDATVVVGGAACVTGMLFLTPLADSAADQPVPLLVALLYPLLDVVLVLIVAAQAMLRARAWTWRTLVLALGFLTLAFADLSLLSYHESGVYEFTPQLNALWALALTMIVMSAAQVREEVAPDHAFRPGSSLLVGAAAIAVLLLAWPEEGALGALLKWPAIVTLVAAGARLVLALRESRMAGEAIRLARTDDLTDLPNRRFVLARLLRGIKRGEPLTLLLVDLDGFKEVNESLGHSAGDDVLRLAADRIRRSVPADVVVARLSGDEFALVVADDDQLNVLEIGQRVRRALRQPARLDGLELVLHSTVGVATRVAEDTTGQDILRRADIALYEAKTTRAGVLAYDPGTDVYSRERLRLAEDLRRAIDDARLEVWYQPQIHASTQRVCGMEALVRWRHAAMGVVPPAAFLPTARRSGLMLALSEVVVRHVLADVARWRSRGMRFPVSINVAPPELLGNTLMPWLFDEVRGAGLESGALLVEVTEDSFLSEPERAREVLLECNRHGLGVSVDDFGTGFSSLSYLRDLPLDELKIDRSFVAASMTDPKSRSIVDFVTQMAHALGVRIVAEGVEDATTMAELVAVGVDVLQGYHLSRPIPSGEVEAWVHRWEREVSGQEPVHRLPN